MLQDMNTTKTIQKLETQIAQIKTLLQRHGAMRPGSLSRQYNVCGKPGCRCKDRAHPRRHGPYYQLNYVYRGKKTSRFIRREILDRKSTRLNSSHGYISYAVFCLKKKKQQTTNTPIVLHRHVRT